MSYKALQGSIFNLYFNASVHKAMEYSPFRQDTVDGENIIYCMPVV